MFLWRVALGYNVRQTPVIVIPKPKILHWTWHSREKMNFYRLSEARVRRVLHSPFRTEEGVAPKTWASMQPAGNGKHEIWVMYEDVGSKRKIISAWRYPGRTKPRSEAVLGVMRQEYANYLAAAAQERLNMRKIMKKSKWFRAK
jgi:hypothetical protein